MIRVSDIRKSYGSIVAVDGLSFEVARGELFGLLGPNGAGKTTLIHLLAGALRPDGGSVQINGQNDPTRAAVRRQFGLAPQTLALYDELTARENLQFFGRLYGLSPARRQERTSWALEFAGLTDRADDRTKTYSGGMKRRLNLACALVHDPPVLFLDEPTVGVDPQSRNHLLESIAVLAREGKTILYTTHYMEEAERLCQRVAIIDHGKVLALDTVDNLLAGHGGKSAVEVELAPPLPDMTGISGNLDGHRLRLESARPIDDLLALKERGVKIGAFRVDRPNLESVFLALTGRRLRDE